MRTVFFIYCWLFASYSVVAQRPDSVQVNGKWYFVYPIKMKMDPSDHYLNVVGLNTVEFEQYRDWTQAKDPRLELEKDSLISALRKSIIDDKILTTQQYGDVAADYSEKKFHRHNCLIRLSKGKPGLRRKLRHATRELRGNTKSFTVKRKVNRNDLRRTLLESPEYQHRQLFYSQYSLPPSEKNLPDGNYILYYDDFFSVTDWREWELNAARTAATFSLKDNLLNGDFKLFSYEGKSLISGTYTNGLRQGEWQIKNESYYTIEYKEGWFYNRKYKANDINTDSLALHFDADLLDGECSYFRWIGDQPIEKDWSGHYKNGFPQGQWYHNELNNLIFKGDIQSINDSVNHEYVYSWIDCTIPSSDSLYSFSWLPSRNDYRELWYDAQAKGIENSGMRSLSQLKDLPLRNLVQSRLPVDKFILYHPFDTYCELFSELKPGVLLARFYRNKELKLITGSRYFENGVLFDTCGFDEQGQLMYKQFDNTGKLYLTSWLDQKGEHIRSVYSTPRKKLMMGGFEVEEEIYSDGFFWDGDTIVFGKRFFRLTWNEEAKRNFEDYYDISKQQLIEKSYDEKGTLLVVKTIPFSHEAMALFEAEYNEKPDFFQKYYYLRSRLLNFDSYQKQTFWGNLTFEEENMNGQSRIKLLMNGKLYTGDLQIKSNDNGKNRARIKGDKLVIEMRSRNSRRHFKMGRRQRLNIPAEVYNEIQADFPVFFQLKLSTVDPYDRVDFYAYFPYTNSTGTMQNGIPSGDWSFYRYDNKIAAEVTYSGENSSGIVYDYRTRVADHKEDLEVYISDPLKEQYEPACRETVSHIFRKTTIANRQREGVCVLHNHVGDTLGLTWYKNGELHGDQWYSFAGEYSVSGDEERKYLIGKFENGKAQGTHIVIEQQYETAVGGGEVVTDTLAVVNFVDGKREGQAWYQPTTTKYELTFANDWPDQELTLKNGQYGTTEHYVFRDGYVDKMQYFKENTLSYEYRLPEKDSFRLELSTLDEMTGVGPNKSDTDPYDWDNDPDKYIKRDETPKKSVFTKFYPDGTIARSGELMKEKKTGRWAYASEDQNVQYVIDYNDSIYVQNNDTFSIIGVQTNLNTDEKATFTQLLLEEKDFYKCTSDEYYSIREYLVPGGQMGNGITSFYYDNGALMSKGALINGLPDGLWQFYNQQGGLTRTGIYKNGKKIGRWLEGDLTTKAYLGDICLDESNPDLDVIISQLERGKKIEVSIYRNGKPVSKQSYESSN